jgi:hypothetical protein
MDIDEFKNTFKGMIHLKNTSSYLDEFGGSLFMTMLILIAFFYICAYFYVSSQLKNLRKDWTHIRCHPGYIPFASMINPDPHMGAAEFTQQNFSYCTNNILTSIAQYFTLPFTYAISVFVGLFETMIKDANIIRNKFADLVNNIISIDKEIMRRILTTVIPIQHMVIKLRDMYKKAVGTLVTGAFTIASGLYIVEMLVKNFITLMIMALYIILAIIIPLLWFFFTWPLAIPPIITFATMAAFLLAVVIILAPVYDIPNTTVPQKPSVPSCFDMQTLLKMNDGSWKYIYELKPYDVLEGGNRITSVFKLSANGVDMYSYKKLIVSGTHRVFISWSEYYDIFGVQVDNSLNKTETNDDMYNAENKKGIWVMVKDIKAPYAVKCENYRQRHIYCLNTEQKYIQLYSVSEIKECKSKLEKIYALDWDEIMTREHAQNLYMNIQKTTGIELPRLSPSLFHAYMESGMSGKNSVFMADGSTKRLCDVVVGDILLSPNVENFKHIAGSIYTKYDPIMKAFVPFNKRGHKNRVLGVVKIGKTDMRLAPICYTRDMLRGIVGTSPDSEIEATQNNTIIGIKDGKFELHNLMVRTPHFEGYCDCVDELRAKFSGCLREVHEDEPEVVYKEEIHSPSWGEFFYSYLSNTKKTEEKNVNVYYHLITTEGMFYVGGCIFADYNMGIDYWEL